MTTPVPSQAAQVAALLTEANRTLLGVAATLSDVIDIADEPDGSIVPPQEAIALVGLTAVGKRNVGFVVDELGRIQGRMLQQNDLADEAADDS